MSNKLSGPTSCTNSSSTAVAIVVIASNLLSAVITSTCLATLLVWRRNSTNVPTHRNLLLQQEGSCCDCSASSSLWALFETFDGDPSSPSQALLPNNHFEFVVTHRTHPQEHFTKALFKPFLADHSQDDCAGPDPNIDPLPQHWVVTRQDSTANNPDESFFICKNHLMSSMGQVNPYSVSAFWPRQEFQFNSNDNNNIGILEFDVNINDGHGTRSWWEIMICPRDELRVGAGPIDSPISETYPPNRIVMDFRRNVRTIKVGGTSLLNNEDSWLVHETQQGPWDFAWWRDLYPNDAALTDHRIRRKMRIQFINNQEIQWSIETANGTFDTWSVSVPGGFPFTQGLVLFKTHAYTPEKDGNFDTYTFHWDNLRFNGPRVGFYNVFEADNVVYLQRNGDRPIGDSVTVTITLPTNDATDDEALTHNNPVLFGQMHQPLKGQTLLSINGGPDQVVEPYEYVNANEFPTDWKSFRLPLDPVVLNQGVNTFKWTVGPRPSDATDEYWNGFSVKFLQIQLDA